MPLIDVAENVKPVSQERAEYFISDLNKNFIRNRDAAYNAVEQFWQRGEDGNLLPETDEKSGIKVLETMGTEARNTVLDAYDRVVMLVSIATRHNKMELLDISKLSAPYDLTFNEDGSLDTWVKK